MGCGAWQLTRGTWKRFWADGATSQGSNRQEFNQRSREEREAINAPIQGSAADIMKIAMLRVPQALKDRGLSARVILQVHDELVLECPEKELARTAELVKTVMADAYELSVPLSTEARYGRNWGEMETFSG